MTPYFAKFYAVFSEGRLIFSNDHGMACIFETKREAKAQMKFFQKRCPEENIEVKLVIILENQA